MVEDWKLVLGRGEHDIGRVDEACLLALDVWDGVRGGEHVQLGAA